MRSIFGGLGLALTGRAFAGWIAGAIKAAEVTGEHAQQIKVAKDTLDTMKRASDDLALSIGTKLTPAMQGLTAVFIGWNRLISGADPFKFEAQIEAARSRVESLQRQLAQPRLRNRSGISAELERVSAQLDELIRKQEAALGLGAGGVQSAAFARQNLAMRRTVEGLTMVGDAYEKFAGLKRPNIALDELVPPDGLSEILVGAKPISLDDLIKPFPAAEVAALFAPIKTEGMKVAESLGDGFRFAFADWILDTEQSFGDMLRRMAVQMATSALFSALGGLFGNATGGAGKFFSSFFGGARANGGPVSSGRAYLVGERGPELFMPGQSGMIAAGAGGLTYNDYSTFQVSGGGGREERAALKATLDAHRKQTMSEIQQLIRRGRF